MDIQQSLCEFLVEILGLLTAECPEKLMAVRTLQSKNHVLKAGAW